jgi:hypothetical protein
MWEAQASPATAGMLPALSGMLPDSIEKGIAI